MHAHFYILHNLILVGTYMCTIVQVQALECMILHVIFVSGETKREFIDPHDKENKADF